MRATPASTEVALQDATVDRRQRLKIGDRHALVDLMHGLPEEAELDHRAIILDEARVRSAAGGRERGPPPGGLGDRGGDEIDEGAGPGEKNVRVGRLPV